MQPYKYLLFNKIHHVPSLSIMSQSQYNKECRKANSFAADAEPIFEMRVSAITELDTRRLLMAEPSIIEKILIPLSTKERINRQNDVDISMEKLVNGIINESDHIYNIYIHQAALDLILMYAKFPLARFEAKITIWPFDGRPLTPVTSDNEEESEEEDDNIYRPNPMAGADWF